MIEEQFDEENQFDGWDASGDEMCDLCAESDDAIEDVSDEPVLKGIKSKFDYALSFCEANRAYIPVVYKGDEIEVKPIGVFGGSGKYILVRKDGSTLMAKVSEFTEIL